MSKKLNIMTHYCAQLLVVSSLCASTHLSASSIREQFRSAYDYAVAEGFKGGFPTFHQAEYDEVKVLGHVLLNDNDADWQDVPASQLGNTGPSDPLPFFRAVYDYAHHKGYVGGIPNFHQADYGHGTVYGVMLLKSSGAEWKDIPEQELDISTSTDIPHRFQKAVTYAQKLGFTGAYPNFHQADYGHGTVYGTILIKGGEFRDVPVDIMHMYKNYSWDQQISRDQRLKILKQLARGYIQLGTCDNPENDQKEQLIANGYRKNIQFGIETREDVNGAAIKNGNQIWINFNVLFPQGNDEIAQTLIHEMMHCAGYSHPPMGKEDKPHDGGKYYSSPPLKAELCIAGKQSFAIADQPNNKIKCVPEDNKYSIKITDK